MFKGKLFYCNIINIKFKCHKFYVKPPPDLSPQLVKRNRKKQFPALFQNRCRFWPQVCCCACDRAQVAPPEALSHYGGVSPRWWCGPPSKELRCCCCCFRFNDFTITDFNWGPGRNKRVLPPSKINLNQQEQQEKNRQAKRFHLWPSSSGLEKISPPENKTKKTFQLSRRGKRTVSVGASDFKGQQTRQRKSYVISERRGFWSIGNDELGLHQLPTSALPVMVKIIVKSGVYHGV